MINKDGAKIMAILAIAKLFGKEYVRSHINKACETYPDGNDIEYIYFLGFEYDGDLWSVFAKVLVNRETNEVRFLDYKTLDGERMKNPPSPISFAQ